MIIQKLSLGEATCILGIRIYRDRSRKLLGLSQSMYINKMLKRFSMDLSKKGFVPWCIMNRGVIVWKSSKQVTTADSTTKAEYIAASERKWFGSRSSLDELGVVPSNVDPIPLYCDNNGVIAQAKEPRSHHRYPNMFSSVTIWSGRSSVVKMWRLKGSPQIRT